MIRTWDGAGLLLMPTTFTRLAPDSPRTLGVPSSAAHPGRVTSALRIAALIVAVASLGAALAACRPPAPDRPRPTTGAIAGLARDHDSGDPIAKAEISVRAEGSVRDRVTTTSDRGLYDVDQLAPGRYHLVGTFAGQPIEVLNIDVRAGESTLVDLVFTLGRPEGVRIDFGSSRAGAIDRYRPKGLPASVAIIEGTVNDAATRQRVPGAVVTAVGDDVTQTQQTLSDDHGRYRFDSMPPGVYSVSAYYSISGRGQIEVRRSGIHVEGAEAVVVPLWIEMNR